MLNLQNKKLRAISMLFVGMFLAMPVSYLEAQAPTSIEGCTIVRPIAVGDTTFQTGSVVNSASTNDWGAICLVNLMNKVIDALSFIIIPLAILMIVVAGVFFMISRGDPTAGKIIVAALVGLVIFYMARLLPGVVVGIIT